MNDEYLSQTEIGRLYGVSSHQIGKWLLALGLRTNNKKPSAEAFQGGYVEKRDSTQLGTYFWVWNTEKTLRTLDEAGHKRAEGAA